MLGAVFKRWCCCCLDEICFSKNIVYFYLYIYKMARFGTADILSPIQSDISLSNISALSFGSLSTPEYDKNIGSSVSKYIEKNTDIDSFCRRAKEETAHAFEAVLNDAKAQSGINAEREVKYKESYEMLKQSMDEVFYSRVPNSVLSPVESLTFEEVSKSKTKTAENAPSSKVYKKTSTSGSKALFQVPSKKTEKSKKVSFNLANTEQKSKNNMALKLPTTNANTKLSHGSKLKSSKTTSSSAQPVRSLETGKTLSKELPVKKETKAAKSLKAEGIASNELHKEKETKVAKSLKAEGIASKQLHKEKETKAAKSSKAEGIASKELHKEKEAAAKSLKVEEIASEELHKETETTKSLEAEEAPPRELNTEKGVEGSRTVKDFQFKCQQKIAVSDVMPTVENKSLSIEKSIQIAIGMEMDKMRNFILDLNVQRFKDLNKLRVELQEQALVTDYLFSQVEELLEINRKLISKLK